MVFFKSVAPLPGDLLFWHFLDLKLPAKWSVTSSKSVKHRLFFVAGNQGKQNQHNRRRLIFPNHRRKHVSFQGSALPIPKRTMRVRDHARHHHSPPAAPFSRRNSGCFDSVSMINQQVRLNKNPPNPMGLLGEIVL